MTFSQSRRPWLIVVRLFHSRKSYNLVSPHPEEKLSHRDSGHLFSRCIGWLDVCVEELKKAIRVLRFVCKK